ncbi:MAG: SH3 domain-containing protein [Thermomicrobia bacterium]|nr:SH3 domain-containing protein [Thermomicrobia bacterium]MCA1723310.1 SH3 domain-containing protein [Thermomicrobia bacterium]
MRTSAWLRQTMAWGARWSLIPLVAAPLLLAACGQDQGQAGAVVIITPAPPTPTSVAHSLTPPPTLAVSTIVAFPSNAPTITNVTGSQLIAGVKAKVKDSADGLVLRASPSTKAKALESLAAGTVLNVLANPQDAEGRTWVNVSHGSNQGFVAAEFIDRIP